jgi:hypothetical protein
VTFAEKISWYTTRDLKMTLNEKILIKILYCFSNDSATMCRYYHSKIGSDPIDLVYFRKDDVCQMWKMLIAKKQRKYKKS